MAKKEGPEPEKGKEQRRVQANITADEETRRGVYSTHAFVSHTREEFLFDFFFFSPMQPQQGQLVSRVVMSPSHLKRFLRAAEENLRRYEAKHGDLPEPEPSATPPPDSSMVQ